MSFQSRHINRLKMPTKHVLVCEDDLSNQAAISAHFRDVFEPQGLALFTFVSGGMAAAGVISWTKVDLIVLDHDMPFGNGMDLINWLKEQKIEIPIITFSGINQNNQNMMHIGAKHLFSKQSVIQGEADSLIKSILGVER